MTSLQRNILIAIGLCTAAIGVFLFLHKSAEKLPLFGGTSTAGYTTIGASDYQGGTTSAVNNPAGLLITIPSAATISKVTAYINTTISGSPAGSGTIRARLYNGSAGSLGSLVATTNTNTFNATFAWVDFTFATPVAVSAGTYWIEWEGLGGGGPGTAVGHIRYDTGGAVNTGYIKNDSGTPIYDSNQYSIYATYTTGTQTTDTYTSSGTWVAPAGVTSVSVDAWGAGGGGAGATAISGSTGGGGGAYAHLNAFSVTPGNSYTVTVGTGGAVAVIGSVSGTSTFAATSTLSAAPGWGGNGTVTGGPGGAVASSTGDILQAGGRGGGPSSGWGGSGGGAGGSTANGNPGTTSSPGCINGTGGTGGATGGGNGGSSNTATAPTTPGGGGYGSSSSVNCTGQVGVAGARGEVRITYTLSSGGSTDTTPRAGIISGQVQINGGSVILP